MLEFVNNEQKYWDFIRELRSDDRVQAGFRDQVKITPEQQSAYMAKYNDNYWVCLCDGKPAGYIGEIERDIRIAVHPDYQKRGIGKFLVNNLMQARPESAAVVKIENEASLALFRSCGFKDRYIILEKEQK